MFILILAWSIFTKIPRLTDPENFYFDEVYHGFTATQYLHNNTDAYDPWARPPPGVAFEWTHPPLSKLAMAGFMTIFGENSFGWRIGSVVLGTAAIFLTGMLALELFGIANLALLTAFLMSIEGLVFSQSRIAMNDIYFIFFALFSMWGYVKWRKTGSLRSLYLCGVMLGCAAATKWTTLYFFGLYGIDLTFYFIKSRKNKTSFPLHHFFVVFILIPAGVYLLSYTHFFFLGNNFERFIIIQKQMWGYHSGLKASHPYQSVPWQWILNLRPVWMHAAWTNQSMVDIYNFGNSIILLGGLGAVGLTMFNEKIQSWEKSWEKWFTLLAYFLLWVPWCFSPRIIFFYHYLPAIPFLCILLSRKLLQLNKRIVVGFSVLALAWFVLFYPHNTGLPVSRSMEFIYFGVPGWR